MLQVWRAWEILSYTGDIILCWPQGRDSSCGRDLARTALPTLPLQRDQGPGQARHLLTLHPPLNTWITFLKALDPVNIVPEFENPHTVQGNNDLWRDSIFVFQASLQCWRLFLPLTSNEKLRNPQSNHLLETAGTSGHKTPKHCETSPNSLEVRKVNGIFNCFNTDVCLGVSYTLVTLSSKLGAKPGAKKIFILVAVLLTPCVTTPL